MMWKLIFVWLGRRTRKLATILAWSVGKKTCKNYQDIALDRIKGKYTTNLWWFIWYKDLCSRIWSTTALLKIKKVNIRIEEMSKIASIGNYWDDKTIGHVVDLLQEYQDLFSMKFEDMNDILEDLGVMRIPLKEGAKPVKQHPYWLNPRYKEKVRK